MKFMKTGIVGLGLIAGFTGVQAGMVSGIAEMKTPGTEFSDTVFEFTQAIPCKSESDSNCTPHIPDFFIDSVGLHSQGTPRLEDWGSIALDSGNINVYGEDSVAYGLEDLQWQLDSTISAMHATGDSDEMAADIPWDQVQPGEIFEAITADGHYAILVPIGDYQGDGYTKHAFYWTYQDDGSANLFDPTTSIRKANPGMKQVSSAYGVRVDGLGRVSPQVAEKIARKIFLVPSPGSRKSR